MHESDITRLEQVLNRIDKLSFSLLFLRDYVKKYQDDFFEWSPALLDNMGGVEATLSVIGEGLLTELEEFGGILADLRKVANR